MTFDELYNRWWSVHKLSLKPVTVYKNDQQVIKHLLPYFGGRDILDITDLDVSRYAEAELSGGNRQTHGPLSPNTVSREVGYLKRIFDYGCRIGCLSLNPASAVRIKHVPHRKFAIYTPDEVRRLIEAARPHWMGDIILLAYRTGMRRGEIYGLQWDDIDFRDKLLTVRRSVSSYDSKTKFVSTPKTASSNRVILLDQQALDMLQRRFTKRTSDTWVFANQYGDLMSPWYNVKYFRAACKAVEIEGKRFHDLRHTHITELIAAGISLPIVQQRAGHSNISMTMHYTHISYNMQVSAVNYLNTH